MKTETLAISIGCPSGIGPEIALLAAANATHEANLVLVGDLGTLKRAAALRHIDASRLRLVQDKATIEALKPFEIGVLETATQLSHPPPFGAPNQEAGRAQLAWINEALALVERGIAHALVTGPVSKHAIATSGAEEAQTFLGHTEHLAKRLRAAEVVMAFYAKAITTALVTTHLPLADVPKAITKEAVATSAYWLARLVLALGKESPTIAIAALNPHAGEGGLLGSEEETAIKPGIDLARERLERAGQMAELVGPIGAETAFRKHVQGTYDAVLAMYHDQATIPSKLLSFGEAVNVTLGLPIIRTSVDHGTGYDIAGTSLADARGMESALGLAMVLCRSTMWAAD